MVQHLLPQINELISKDSGYLFRITGFYSIQVTIIKNRKRVNRLILKIQKKSKGSSDGFNLRFYKRKDHTCYAEMLQRPCSKRPNRNFKDFQVDGYNYR